MRGEQRFDCRRGKLLKAKAPRLAEQVEARADGGDAEGEGSEEGGDATMWHAARAARPIATKTTEMRRPGRSAAPRARALGVRSGRPRQRHESAARGRATRE